MRTIFIILKKKKWYILLTLFFILLVVGGYFGISYLEKANSEKQFSLVLERNLENEKEDVKEEKKVDKDGFCYVDIKGEVNNPGVYMLDSGKRVIDVVNAAGGFTEKADTSVNNLSRTIFDEMVIIIYSKDEVKNFASVKEKTQKVINNISQDEKHAENDAVIKPSDKEPEVNMSNDSTSNNTSPSKISLNSATKEELITLPGIGESKAMAILKYREDNGGFKKIEDLMKVSGIGEATYQQIKDRLVL